MRVLYYDYIRAIAIILVVLVHITAPSLLSEGAFLSRWQVCLSANTLARVGVPLFFMLSGALFLNKNKIIDFVYIRKKIQRIVLAYFFFSFLYSFIWFVGKYHFDFTYDSVIDDFLPRFLNGWFHLWFLQALFVLYLLTPVLRQIAIEKRICYYFALILFVVCSLFPFIGNFVEYESYFGELLTNMAFLLPQYALYFLVGYLCSQLQYGFNAWYLGCLGGGLLIFVFIFDMIRSLQTGQPVILWGGYLSPLIVVSSCMVFLFVRRNVETGRLSIFYKMVKILSTNAFGVYLIHVFFVEGLIRAHIFPLMGMQVWFIPLFLFLIIAVCSFMTILLRKIRIVDYLLC